MQVVYSLLRGGSERLACELALRLDPDCVRSSICALAMGGPVADTLADAGIPFDVIGCAPGRQWPTIVKLYRVFRKERVDVVQTHHLKQLVYSAVGARLAGAKLVHVEHDCWSLRPPKAQRCLRTLAPLCHRIVAVGESIRDFLVREVGLPASKVTTIPNGVDVTHYSPTPTLPREALGLVARRRLIGHVARLEPEKDQETLLRAFDIVLRTCSDARLVIIGDGSERANLERTVRSLGVAAHVDFLGLRTDVAALIPHLQVFALSSRNEGLPLVILEAMACARPVVAPAVGEIPQVVRDGVTGVTVPPGDPTALAGALVGILERPQWAATMGLAARQVVEQQYSLTRVIQQYDELYASLFAPAPSADRAHLVRREPEPANPNTST